MERFSEPDLQRRLVLARRVGLARITPNALKVTELFGSPNSGGTIRVVGIERKAHEVTAAVGLTGVGLVWKGTVPGSWEPFVAGSPSRTS
jgi:hypothetical protein